MLPQFFQDTAGLGALFPMVFHFGKDGSSNVLVLEATDKVSVITDSFHNADDF